ncbi:hypothetical protein SDC9_110064 [bioreactor metagenome]|uniref:Uncharacterized protein n=1 Tax=bioreactor metagenome TaxID=1076179 RepID=A0A645BN19_9ZZZZ
MGTGILMYAGNNKDYIPASSALYSIDVKYTTDSTGSFCQIMLGGYFGEIPDATGYFDFYERHGKCPSDTVQYRDCGTANKYLSYAYLRGIGQASNKLPARLIVGRDDPGVAVGMDVGPILHPTWFLASNAHVTAANAIYLGGHTGTRTFKQGDKAADLASGAKFFDEYKID